MTGPREDHVDTEFEAPANDLEQGIAAILAEVLSVDRIGRTDSFYDFSGTSLQAIRICVRIEQRLGIKAKPEWLFSHDVVEDLARRLAEQQQEPVR
ncbi:phosphopantetheine-binding protein [Streptomyces hyaluromycini]|uniref:Phosphopantetheine-binding protein n=1 Tax=Streptomyces hyaluromycini TaxID=1377993 RepID=A0ABV1XDA0_9ACTN